MLSYLKPYSANNLDVRACLDSFNIHIYSKFFINFTLILIFAAYGKYDIFAAYEK